jgi:hypothetical protein
MILIALYLALLLYVPGAVVFRLPLLDRPRRAALEAGERAYWALMLSAGWTSLAAFALAAAGRYTFGRLIALNIAASLAAIVAYRRRLLLGPLAPRPNLAAAVPVLLVLLGAYLFYPPAEYVIGGKDPGVYVNEGIQIGQRGALVTHDPVVAAVPPPYRNLFYPSHRNDAYYSVRFMGFFIMNPDTGAVVGQFPHLLPLWIAIGYGVYGLTGALHVLGIAAIVGVLGLYFAGARIVGRTAAGVAAALLAISVIEVWFARYPNAEMLGQALLFGGLLAFGRSHIDGNPFFEPVAAVLLGLLLFARIDGILGVAGIVSAALLVRVVGIRLKPAFIGPLMLFGFAAFAYFVVLLSAYASLPLYFLRHPTPLQIAFFGGAALLVLVLYALTGVAAVAAVIRAWLPRALAVFMVALALYAFFLRQPGGRLALHDANSLRMFAWYLHPAALALSLIGLTLVCWRQFWQAPAFILSACTYALFVFYKIQIVPEHFWMARRFVMMIMPAALLFASAAIFTGFREQLLRPARTARFMAKGDRFTRIAIRLVLLTLVASSLLAATRAILTHVEYRGVIPKLEALASRFGDRDLVIVESRNASDAHVLALPLAYIYARNVLVLNSPKPNKALFTSFLGWARSRYAHVYFLGGGGTDLLSRHIGVEDVGGDRFQVPEYESLRNAYPTHVRRKEFDYGLYVFRDVDSRRQGFSLDVGVKDDLNVVRFHAKERSGDKTFRWTRNLSYIAIPGLPATVTQVSLVMENGGRPGGLPPATVSVFFDDRALGTARVGPAKATYTFAIPADVAAAAGASDDAALLKLVCSTWNPRASLGVDDGRDLGVMVDRVEVR